MDSIINSVYKTKTYERFNHIKGNRLVNKANLIKIVNSIKIKDLKVPIIVNENYEVIDGQHRLESYRYLKKPIHYIIMKGYGLEDVHRINSVSKTWSYNDFMDGYSGMGNENYILYKKFKNKYKFGHRECLRILKGQGCNIIAKDVFDNGSLKLSNKEYNAGCIIADMVYAIKPYYKGFKRQNFVLALLDVFNKDIYDHNVFIKRLSNQSMELTDQPRTEQYIQLIEKIYNFRSRNKIRLY